MTTTSHPIVDVNVDHAQWRGLFSDVADGIVGADGSSSSDLRLTLSSTDNTATIGLGRLRYRGFELEVTAAHALTLPAATSSPITYTLGVVYDPAKESDALGPLALAASATVPAGGSFMTLYQVTRQVGQVLSAATVAEFRTFCGPSLVVLPGATKPVTGVPVGAHLWDGADLWVMTHNAGRTGKQWSNITNPAWTTITLAASWSPGVPAPAWRVKDGDVELSGFAGLASAAGVGLITLGYLPAVAQHSGAVVRIHGVATSGSGYRAVLEVWGKATASPGRVDVRFYDSGITGVGITGMSYALR